MLSTAGSSVVVIGSPNSGQSGGPQVVATDPPDGATLVEAPGSITVTFDRPIIGEFSSADLRLDSVEPDGTETTVDSGSGLAESLGADPRDLIVTPGGALGPGQYRLYLLGSSPLAGSDGADRMIDDFTIGTPVPTIGAAIDLGSPVSNVVTTSGSLDLADDPGATDYYRVELPQGHFWRLGAEVEAQQIGSALLSTLTVYNAQGQAIPSQVDRLPGDPNDPYLFLGLEPGVYYIGVSGTDLPAGTPPSRGNFRLQVVADSADAPTTVVSSTLDYADPTAAIPTGLTLRFNGPLDASAMAGNPSDLIQLVDASGRAWAADAVAYDVMSSTVTFVFEQALPAGRYAVQLAGQGGLVDLVGKPPVAPGLPAGTLADFTVARATATRGSDDYGPIFLNQLQQGLSANLQLAPGEEVTYRFVITAAAFYDLETTYTGSAPTFTANVGGKSVALDPGAAGIAQNHIVHLQPGVITLDVKGGSLGTSIDWSFLLVSGSYDLLLDNGVGQSSGLGLRLVGLSTPDSLAATSSSGLTPGPAPSAGPTASSTSSSGTPGASPGAAGLFLAANVGLVGHPSGLDDAVAVVGPVAPGGMTALSTTASGIPQGLTAGFGRGSQASRSLNSGAIEGLVEVPETLATAADSAPVPIVDLPPLPEIPTGAADPIVSAPGGGLIERLSGLLARLGPSGRRTPESPGAAALDDLTLASVGGAQGPGMPEGEGAVESVDASVPLGLSVIVVGGVHYGRRFGGWLGRRKARAVALAHGTSPTSPRRPTA